MNKVFGFIRKWPVAAVLTVVFLLTVVWWITIFARGIENTSENYWFGFPLALIPFFGAVYVLLQAKRRRTQMQKFLSTGLLLMGAGSLWWSLGSFVFLYYNVALNIAVPYPSIADIGYCFSYPCWIVGLFFLNLSLGFAFRLRTVVQQMLFFLLPFVVISVSYYLFFVFARGGAGFDLSESPVKAFFDIAYPGFDTLIFLLLSILMYELFLGTKIPFKNPVIILCIAFFVEYVGDLGFSYTTFHGTYFTSMWVDLLFLIAMFLIVFGLSMFVRQVDIASSKKELTH